MHSEDRLIHFSTELIHRPVPIQIPPLQKLYYDLSQTRATAYDSSDFNQQTPIRFHSRRGAKSHSVAVFLPDRVALIEEWADMSLSEFYKKVEEVGRRLFEARGFDAVLTQTATLRSTFTLTNFDDARVFLLDHACKQANRIAPHFGRPVSVGGLRFVLPETAEAYGNLHVTIESFRQARDEVYVEVKGIFAQQQITPASLDKAVENIQGVRRFITDRIFPYLNQFDRPEEDLV